MSGRRATLARRPAAEPGPAVERGRVPLAAVVVLGVAIRVAWLLAHRHLSLGGDPFYYHQEANLVAAGKGFVEPAAGLTTVKSAPSAIHPPLFVLYLALWSLAGARSVFWHLVASTVLGSSSVYVLAVTARRLGGARVGVICGFLAAVAPNLWVWDGLLYSETMAIFTVALFLYRVVRYLEQPSGRALVWVAGCAALCGLARSELILVALAVVPLVLRTQPVDRARVIRHLGACVVVIAVLVAPWAIYNQTRFHHPVPLSTGLGLVTVSSTCDSAWYGSRIGYWDFGCSVAGDTAARAGASNDADIDESDLDLGMRRVAEHYVEHHMSRIPAVVGARLGRVTGLFRPIQQAELDATQEGATPLWLASTIMSTWYLFAGLAMVGAFALRKAGVPLLALCSPILAVLLTTVFTYGLGRFRAPAEAVIMVLAAIGFDHLARRRLEGRAGPEAGSLLATFAGRSAGSRGATTTRSSASLGLRG